MLIDLQLHSTYSDGYLTPTELVNFIAKKGIKVASLTDHNTVAGLDEFIIACKKFNIKAIPGLELYVKLGNKRFNLLWFNYNQTNPLLHQILRSSQIRRRSNVRTFLKKLIKKGLIIDIEKILDKYNHYVPLNRIIDEVFNNFFNKKIAQRNLGKLAREEEIIAEYFYNKKIGRLNESFINFENILKLRKKIGGQLIINHPGKYGYFNKELLLKLKKMGVDGIEVLSPHHNIGAVMYYQFLAETNNLIMSGGSDFHRFEKSKYQIKSSWDYYRIDSKYLKRIEKIIN